MTYKDTTYVTEWLPSNTHSGEVQQIGQYHNKYLPMNTHHIVLTTGDYSDPSKVTISKLRKGRIVARYTTQPKGSIEVLHLIPSSVQMLKKISRIKTGQKVELTGQEEKDNKVNSDAGYYAGGSKDKGHYLFLLQELR